MQKLLLLLTTILLIVSCGNENKTSEKLLLGGSYWNDIVILDKTSGVVEWRYHIADEDLECNSLAMTEDGTKIFLTYKKGVRLIDRATSKTLWEYPAGEGEEIHSAKIYGSTLVAVVCGVPARIVEFDINGTITKELTVDTEIENPHSQFRQVTKLSNGNYIMPMFAKKVICEISSEGRIVREVKSPGVPFSVVELKDGNWLYGAGDSHAYYVLNPNTGEIVKEVTSPRLAFAAEPLLGEDGSVLVCSWVGHSKTNTECKMVEFDATGNEIWTLAPDKEGVGMVSAAYRFFE